MGRVILYGLLISLLQSNPTLQTFSVAISTLVYLYLVVKYKPFVSNCMNIITIITGKPPIFNQSKTRQIIKNP